MPAAHPPVTLGLQFLRDLWRLGRVYWTSPDAPRGAGLLALAVALELATVGGNVLVARAQAEVIDVLQEKNVAAFLGGAGYLVAAMLFALFATTFRIYVRQALEIRWREYLTAEYLRRWVHPQAYWQAELHGKEMDNPDQRIAEDVRNFVASALGLSLSLLAALATLASFGGMLWTLSRAWPVHIAALDFQVPGLMLWVAIVYALFAMWVTHLVGRKLVPINFDRLRYEADFRYGLVRFRDHIEPIALSRGEDLERASLRDRFQYIVLNWWQLIRAQRDLALLTMGIGQANAIVPVAIAAPAYFAGHLTLGNIAQVNFAYGQVSGALTWFVNAYQEIALWRASIHRLVTFSDVMTTTDRELHAGERIAVTTTGTDGLALDDLRLTLPDGRPLLHETDARIAAGEHVALIGPTGAGKTTLIRALAGLWPFGSGRIALPRDARLLFVPPRPYVPVGTLRAAVSYPAPEGTFSDQRICEALQLFGLGQLDCQLDQVEHWDQRLSVAEQQRLSLARVLLHAPDWVFLDEATSAIDERMEERAYALLRERLPDAALLSIAHRNRVADYCAHRWTLMPHDHSGSTLQTNGDTRERAAAGDRDLGR